ncbi:MAG: acetyl-CoA carboxylase, biotin carboxyl carrier protein [Alphaproteobacteria bacterium]|nr:acetyl-CoA carboxylase, biotin carboxyl carrier protein [Alphaproteobacteria bacterium]
MVDKVSFDADLVRQLAELLNQTDLSEIEYESGNQRIKVARHAKPSQIVHVASELAPHPQLDSSLNSFKDQPLSPETQPLIQGEPLKSPMVGTAYLAAEPGALAFVKEGDSVTEGQTLLIIEAMKVMNPIRAPKSGTLVKIVVQDAAPVEFDEILMFIH